MSEKHCCQDCKYCYSYTSHYSEGSYKEFACKARKIEKQEIDYVTGKPTYTYKGYHVNKYNNPDCKYFNKNGDCELFIEKDIKSIGWWLKKIKEFIKNKHRQDVIHYKFKKIPTY